MTPEQRRASQRKASLAWYYRNPGKGHAHRADPQKRQAEYRQNRLRKFRITAEKLRLLFVDQMGVCAICEMQLADEFSGYIDHDHATGTVRGILCNGCNTGLGMFRESCAALASAIKYLTTRK